MIIELTSRNSAWPGSVAAIMEDRGSLHDGH
jgi:hypothetical protein